MVVTGIVDVHCTGSAIHSPWYRLNSIAKKRIAGTSIVMQSPAYKKVTRTGLLDRDTNVSQFNRDSCLVTWVSYLHSDTAILDTISSESTTVSLRYF